MEIKDIVKEWFRYANMDLDAAKFLNENTTNQLVEIICFHCQQAAEKYIKALIIFTKMNRLKSMI